MSDSESVNDDAKRPNVGALLGMFAALRGGARVATHPAFQSHLARRREAAAARRLTPEWEAQQEAQAIARRPLVRFHEAKRRAAQLQRRPPWADLDAMRGIYAEAQRLTRETGVPHHVDHVIPLQGKRVSGLHVPNNLQILTGTENSRKRNKYEIDV